MTDVFKEDDRIDMIRLHLVRVFVMRGAVFSMWIETTLVIERSFFLGLKLSKGQK